MLIIWDMYFMCGFYIYVSSLLDHDIIKHMMIFFPHHIGCLLYFLNRPYIIYDLRMYIGLPDLFCWFPV